MNNEEIIIDPVAMNIVNRIAPGTSFTGNIECNGGLIIEGTLVGDVTVTNGPLVLMESASITGDILCSGDAYLFGKILPGEGKEFSNLDADGAVFMAQTLEARANITAGAIKTFDGAQVDGRIRTVRRPKSAETATPATV